MCSFLFPLFSGLIGRSWAMIFASAGYEVVIYDVEHSQVKQLCLFNTPVDIIIIHSQTPFKSREVEKELIECFQYNYLFQH